MDIPKYFQDTIQLIENLSKADDMHDIGLSYHNYHEHNNSELRVLRVMLGNRRASVWFACIYTLNGYLKYEQAT